MTRQLGQGVLSRVRTTSPLKRTGTYTNPPFDPRILSLSHWGAGLSRGFIRCANTAANGDYGVNFLYNPSVLDVSHGVNPSLIKDPSALDPNDASSYIGSTSATASFSLLFDRTYETSDPGMSNTEAGIYGVYADIRAFYQMLGMVPQQGTTNFDEYLTAPMGLVPVILSFGQKVDFFSLNFYGYITGLGIEYSHWTRDMVPNRAAVSVQMDVWPYKQGNSYRKWPGPHH